MKKFFGRLLATTMVFALVLGFAVPVQANTVTTTLVDYGTINFEMPEMPASFDFATEFSFGLALSGERVPAEAVEVASIFDGFTIRERGTVYTNGLAMSMFTEIEISLEQLLSAIPEQEMQQVLPMMALLNIDMNEPFRIWVEMDFSSLENPIFIAVIEMPTIVRLPLMFIAPGLSSQFWVLDLSEEIAELAAYLEAEIRQITDEQRAEMMAYIEEALEELMAELELLLAELEEMLEYYAEEIEEALTEAWAVITEAVNVRVFAFGHDILENGYSAYLNFAATITAHDVVADISFGFAGEITNINTAERVPLPELTAQNSVNLLEYLYRYYAMHPVH